MTGSTYLLEVADLSVSYNTKDSHIKAVNDLSFALREGEFLGLIGESGCGKNHSGKVRCPASPSECRDYQRRNLL